MSKMQDAVRTMQQANNLMDSMISYIAHLRYMVYRYHLMYGELVQGGEVKLDDHADFHIDGKLTYETAKILMFNAEITGYKYLLKQYNELTKTSI